MKHLDEATILAIRDGADAGAQAREHLETCATCATALEEATRRAASIQESLSALDRPIEPTAAKAGVRARLRTRTARKASRWSGWHLGRAAALLLLTAGAATALPGSPLRGILLPAVLQGTPASEPAAQPDAAAESSATVSPALVDAGIQVALPDGVVDVVVRGADPGTELVVEWSDQAAARVTAPPGSRFTYSAGRIELDTARGEIRVALPRAARAVSLQVDGRPYMGGSPSALEVTGPTVERTEQSIRFRVDDS